MTCAEVRDLVLEHHARRLAPEIERVLEAHLATCAACARTDRAERELTELLAARLPRGPAPAGLVRRVAALEPRAAARPASPRRAWIATAIGAAAGIAISGALWLVAGTALRGDSALEVEAVNDHLRLLVAQRPLEIESGGVHQVKPWFEGRLDFAPAVPDLVPLGLTLRGGAVGYFRDRPAAVLQYQLRAHLVTLLAFRSDRLQLPAAPRLSASDRGFHAVLWRAGPLGYALVADVDPRELARVAEEMARAGP